MNELSTADGRREEGGAVESKSEIRDWWFRIQDTRFKIRDPGSEIHRLEIRDAIIDDQTVGSGERIARKNSRFEIRGPRAESQILVIHMDRMAEKIGWRVI